MDDHVGHHVGNERHHKKQRAEHEEHAIMVAAGEQMTFFVPGSVGTLEGIRFTALSAFGVLQVYGVAFGLVARLHQLFWNGLGLLAYALCTRGVVLPQGTRCMAPPPRPTHRMQ